VSWKTERCQANQWRRKERVGPEAPQAGCGDGELEYGNC